MLERRVNHKVSVSYRTVEKSARSGVDFVAISGRVVIPAGAKGRTVWVSVLDDALDEATERFRLRIYDATGASIVDRSGRVTIFDDDPAPTMSVGDVSVTEPTSGSSSLNFPVTLSARSGRTVSVSYVVTAGTATSGHRLPRVTLDRAARPSGRGHHRHHPGERPQRQCAGVLGDPPGHPPPPVNVSIIDGTAVGTIVDNTTPRMSVADVTVTEGDQARFMVR